MSGCIQQIGQFLGIEDGLKSDRCLGGSQPGAMRAKDGSLWFPTAAGVARIEPSHQPESLVSIPPVIESLTADDLEIESGRSAPLSWDTSQIRIQFTVPVFSKPASIAFRYRLLPIRPEWIDVGSERQARFISLSPGQYIFEVQARQPNGSWSLSTNRQFSIAAPYWHQWWFISILFLALAGIGYLVYRGVWHLFRTIRFWRQSHWLGSYQLISILGRGGMGTVHLARHRSSSRQVALKTLDPALTSTETR